MHSETITSIKVGKPLSATDTDAACTAAERSSSRPLEVTVEAEAMPSFYSLKPNGATDTDAGRTAAAGRPGA